METPLSRFAADAILQDQPAQQICDETNRAKTRFTAMVRAMLKLGESGRPLVQTLVAMAIATSTFDMGTNFLV
jgi:hypothetical protein